MPKTIKYTIIYKPRLTDPRAGYDPETEEEPDTETAYKNAKSYEREGDDDEYDEEFLAAGMRIPKNRVIREISEESKFSIDHVIVEWNGEAIEGCTHFFPLTFSSPCVLETKFELNCVDVFSTCYYNLDIVGSSNDYVRFRSLDNVMAVVGDIAPDNLFILYDDQRRYRRPSVYSYESDKNFICYGNDDTIYFYVRVNIPEHLYAEIDVYTKDDRDMNVSFKMH